MAEKSIIITRDLTKPVGFSEKKATIQADRFQESVQLVEKTTILKARPLSDSVQFLGQSFEDLLVEKFTTIRPNGDLATQQWEKSTPTRPWYDHIDNSPATPNDVMILNAYQQDWHSRFYLADAPADLVECTGIRAWVRIKYGYLMTANWIGYRIRVVDSLDVAYVDGTEIHGGIGPWPGAPLNHYLPGPGSSYKSVSLNKSQTDDLRLILSSVGDNWTYFAGIIQISEIDIDLRYMGTP